MRDHHRFLLEVVLDQLDYLSTTIDQLSQRIEDLGSGINTSALVAVDRA